MKQAAGGDGLFYLKKKIMEVRMKLYYIIKDLSDRCLPKYII